MKEIFKNLVYELAQIGASRCVLIKAMDGNILIDTPPISEEMTKNIMSVGLPRFLVISDKSRIGDALAWQKKHYFLIAMHDREEQALKEKGIALEVPVMDREPMTDNARIVHLPTVSEGSCGVIIKDEGGILFTGGCLYTSEAGDIVLPPEVPDAQAAKAVLRKLLNLPFNSLVPAQGPVLFNDAMEKLNEFLK